VLKTHVASVGYKSFGCFRGMLQLFQTNVAKVYQNVAYVAMVVHVCCKGMFPMFISVFERIVVCLSGCCIRFTYMLQMFYLNIVYVCNDFQVLQKHVSNISFVFRRCCNCCIWMFQK